jgi:hypothetical protein
MTGDNVVMSYDDSDSRRISPVALLLVIIGAALIGWMWYMNRNGAGGAPQPAKQEQVSSEDVRNLQRKVNEQQQRQAEAQMRNQNR